MGRHQWTGSDAPGEATCWLKSLVKMTDFGILPCSSTLQLCRKLELVFASNQAKPENQADLVLGLTMTKNENFKLKKKKSNPPLCPFTK